MSVRIVRSEAKCKHCVYLKANYDQKRIRFFCHNHRSNLYTQKIALQDPVCGKFKIEHPRDVRKRFKGISLERKWKERNEPESFTGSRSGGQFLRTINDYNKK